MPRGVGYSGTAHKFIGRKIRRLRDEGKTQEQAVGQAIGMARHRGLKVPERPSKPKSRFAQRASRRR